VKTLGDTEFAVIFSDLKKTYLHTARRAPTLTTALFSFRSRLGAQTTPWVGWKFLCVFFSAVMQFGVTTCSKPAYFVMFLPATIFEACYSRTTLSATHLL